MRDHGVACLDAVERGVVLALAFHQRAQDQRQSGFNVFFHHGGSWLFSNCREVG